MSIQRVVTSGKFELDGGSWDVDNNVWIVGDDHDVVVFDAAPTAAPLIEAVHGRNGVAVVCTPDGVKRSTSPFQVAELTSPIVVNV